MKRVYRRIINIVLAAAVLVLIGMISVNSTVSSASVEPSVSDTDKMEVHFIDVGQGDSTLITCGGHAMLIDAGDDTKGTAIQNYLQKQKIEKLDYLVLTHPDADHIGGAPVIITKFEIGQVFVSNYEKDNKTYQKLIQALDNKYLKYTTPPVGSQYTLGSAVITILAPNGEYDTPNDSSIALRIQNGSNRFLFTGDAEERAEQDILKNGLDVSADVYKAGHHGSKTATSEAFLEAVNPDYAVISCAEGNSYGHPHAETLNTFRANGVNVYRTDEQGTIIAVSDGQTITFNVPPSETWQAGEPTRSSSASSDPDTELSPVIEKPLQDASSLETEKPLQDASSLETEKPSQDASSLDTTELTYVLNTKTKKFHKPSCDSLPTTNRKDSSESRESIIAQGYSPCKRCNP